MITQDTGFPIPAGAGLLPFSCADSAIEAIEELDAQRFGELERERIESRTTEEWVDEGSVRCEAERAASRFFQFRNVHRIVRMRSNTNHTVLSDA